jgi:hypothetical protein
MPRARLKHDSEKIMENILVSTEMLNKIRERTLQPDMSIINQNINVEVPQDMQELIGDDLPVVELPSKRKREYSSKDKNHKRVKISKKDMVKKAMENPVHGPRFGVEEGLNQKQKVKKKAERKAEKKAERKAEKKAERKAEKKAERKAQKKVEKKAEKLDFDQILPSGSLKKVDVKRPSENGLSSLIKSEPKPVQSSSKSSLKPSSNSTCKQKLVTNNGFSAEKLKILVNDSIEMKELVPIPKKKK